MQVPYWRLSGFYTFYFTTLGCFLPFWSLYLEARHFDAPSIGELSAFLIGTKIIAPNFWGWIADRSGKGLRVIRISSFFSAVSFLGFLMVDNYLGFAAVTILFSFFWNASLPQFEALTLAHLKTAPHRYAKIRLWGSIGFIGTVMGIGVVLKHQGIEILPIVIEASLVLTWLIALLIPNTKLKTTQAIEQGIWRSLLNVEVIAFLMVYLLLQIAHTPYYVFYSVLLKLHGYSEVTTSLLWSLGVGSEILIFLCAQRFLNFWSLRSILLISIFLSALRWFVIPRYVDILWIMLIAQLLHAASFGTSHIVAVQLVQKFFGSHPAKGQGLYSSISFGIGGMIGGYYSGNVWKQFGPQAVFDLAAGCCALAFCITLLWVERKRHAIS